MEPHFIDTIFAFASGIQNHWISLVLVGGLGTAVSVVSSRFPQVTWCAYVAKDKRFWSTLGIFLSFIIASFLAFNDEYRDKLTAEHKIQSASGIVAVREITSGAAYTAGESEYMLVFDLPTNSKFKLYLLPNPPEGRKLEIKNGDATVDLMIYGNGHPIDGHPYYVLVNPGAAITVTMVGDTWRIT